MPIRLLSKKEVDIKKKAQEAVALQRAGFMQAREIKSFVDKEIARLNEAKKNREPEKEKIYRDFQTFVAQIVKHRSSLLKEIEELEERKARALEPLDQLTFQLSEWESNLTDKEAKLSKQAAVLQTQIEEALLRESFITQKQAELAKWELSLRAMQKKASLDAQSIAKQKEKLQSDQAKFTKEAKEENQRLREREKDLITREKAVEIKQKEFDLQREEIRKDRLRLESQQQTLKAAFEELRKNNGK